MEKIYIECKQLGDLQSHFDKLCFNLLNFMYGCYCSEFWLVYDYNRELVNRKQCHKDKIESLISMVKNHNSYNTDKTIYIVIIIILCLIILIIYTFLNYSLFLSN